MSALITSVRRWTDWISSIGTDPTLDSWENQRTRLLNQMLLLTYAAVVAIGLFHGVRGNIPPLLFCIFFILLNTALLYLNAIHRHNLARLSSSLIYPFIIFLNMVIAGGEFRGEYALTVMVMVSIIFFQRRWLQILIVAYNFGLFALSQHLRSTLKTPLAFMIEPLDMAVLFGTTLACMVVLVNTFVQEIIDHQSANKRLLKDLIQSNTDLKRFNYMVSHDLRSPIRNIISFAGLTKRQLKSQNIQAQSLEPFIDDIHSNAYQLHNLTNDLLALIRLEQTNIQTEEIALDQLIDNLKSQFSTNPAYVQGMIQYQANGIHIQGTTSLLAIVLQNLIENGLKYNKDAHPIVSIQAKEEGQHVIILIQDNGIGIDPEFRQQIFEPFKRLHGKQFPGTGLGLATCKRIVELHNGSIKVIPSPEGSCFEIILPIKAEGTIIQGKTSTTKQRRLPYQEVINKQAIS